MQLPFKKRVLIIESTGYRLRGAIARNRGGQVQITHLAESTLADPQAALADVIEQLRSFRLPSIAILLTHEAIAAVVELPVDPAVPRSVPQMTELIRWELDAFFAQIPNAPPIGEILVARGSLTYDQVQQIISEQESISTIDGNSGSGGKLKRRFGDIAINLGLLSQAQLDDALKLQGLLRKDDDQDCQCSWSPLTKPADHFSDQFQWLVSGIADNKHRQWVESFEDHRIELKGIMPLCGLAFNMLAMPNSKDRHLIIDLQPSLVAVTKITSDGPEVVEYHYPAGRTLSADYIQSLVDPQSTQVFITSQSSQFNQLINDLSEIDPDRYQQLSVAEKRVPHIGDGKFYVNLVSGVQRFYNEPTSSHHCLIAGKAPGPPMWQRSWFHVTVCLSLVALIIACLEFSQGKKLTEVNVNQVAVSKNLEKNKASASRLKHKIASIKKIKIDLQEAASQLAQQRAMQLFLEKDLPQRGWFVAKFLNALSLSLRNNRIVVVNRVEETRSKTIHISAWSLTQDSAQRFIHTLSKITVSLGMRVANRKIEEKKGRLGIDGYEISIDFAPATAYKKSPLNTTARIAKTPPMKSKN